jgi:type IV secretory pathway component VirB8
VFVAGASRASAAVLAKLLAVKLVFIIIIMLPIKP